MSAHLLDKSSFSFRNQKPALTLSPVRSPVIRSQRTLPCPQKALTLHAQVCRKGRCQVGGSRQADALTQTGPLSLCALCVPRRPVQAAAGRAGSCATDAGAHSELPLPTTISFKYFRKDKNEQTKKQTTTTAGSF